MVGIQDHPYQRRQLDTWSLLAYAAARTSRITLAPDVANLPLRHPAMMAKAAATIDLLSDGRMQLGVGAGAFWEGVKAMDGPARTPGESVDALEEAIPIIRGWFEGERSLRTEGEHYRMDGARPGPQPASPIELWIGAYGPRMLRLTGRLGDGWLPSIGYLKLEDVPARQQAIDDAARKAGREPDEIRRILNAPLEGSSAEQADQLARYALEYRFDTVLAFVPDEDPLGFIRRLGEEAAPDARRRVAEQG